MYYNQYIATNHNDYHGLYIYIILIIMDFLHMDNWTRDFLFGKVSVWCAASTCRVHPRVKPGSDWEILLTSLACSFRNDPLVICYIAIENCDL